MRFELPDISDLCMHGCGRTSRLSGDREVQEQQRRLLGYEQHVGWGTPATADHRDQLIDGGAALHICFSLSS